MKRFGLIGYPLGHSFSKKYFTEKFEREQLHDHAYELFPLQSIHELPGLVSSHPDLIGLNVTIPYKQAVLPYLDATRLPPDLPASNCIKIEDGKLTGFNTDVIGFEKTFVPHLKPHHTRALVLGNGGATAAVLHVLNKFGIEYNVVSRKLHRGSTLTYDGLSSELIAEHTVIINTTPLGTFPEVDRCPDIPYESITSRHYLYDLIYNPAKTLFLLQGEKRGARIVNGYDMLEIQAEESWKIWNGIA